MYTLFLFNYDCKALGQLLRMYDFLLETQEIVRSLQLYGPNSQFGPRPQNCPSPVHGHGV